MRQDQDARSPDIHWPAGFDPVIADLFADNALLVGANCARVLELLTPTSKGGMSGMEEVGRERHPRISTTPTRA